MDQQDNQGSYGNLEPSDSFLKLMIEVEDTLQKFEMETLRRKRLSVNLKTRKKDWVAIAPGVKPVCNELGVAEIMGFLRGRVTIPGRLTKKPEDQIMKDIFHFDRTLIELFSLRADDWALDEELAKPIKESVLSIAQDVIFSAKDGFTAINLKSQYGRHENISTNTPMDTGGGTFRSW